LVFGDFLNIFLSIKIGVCVDIHEMRYIFADRLV
jgi:hypothetical protein